MPKELEAKFKIEEDDVAQIRYNVLREGGKRVGSRKETNELFDTKKGKLDKAGIVVRLRTNEHPDGSDEFIVTYKGKQGSGKIKSREEIEYSVSNPDHARLVFEALGYDMCFSYEKKRETFQLDNCLVEIDLLPKLGFFCEVEGPSGKAIERVIARIGLPNVKLIQKGYGTLIREFFKAKKSKQLSLRFK